MISLDITPRTSLYMTLSGYFILIFFLIIWHGFLYPAEKSPVMITVMIITPLLFPLTGLLKEKPYTYAWTSFIILIYFIHGVVEAWANDEQRILALIEIYLSVQVYIGAIYFARLRGRELKNKI